MCRNLAARRKDPPSSSEQKGIEDIHSRYSLPSPRWWYLKETLASLTTHPQNPKKKKKNQQHTLIIQVSKNILKADRVISRLALRVIDHLLLIHRTTGNNSDVQEISNLRALGDLRDILEVFQFLGTCWHVVLERIDRALQLVFMDIFAPAAVRLGFVLWSAHALAFRHDVRRMRAERFVAMLLVASVDGVGEFTGAALRFLSAIASHDVLLAPVSTACGLLTGYIRTWNKQQLTRSLIHAFEGLVTALGTTIPTIPRERDLVAGKATGIGWRRSFEFILVGDFIPVDVDDLGKSLAGILLDGLAEILVRL